MQFARPDIAHSRPSPTVPTVPTVQQCPAPSVTVPHHSLRVPSGPQRSPVVPSGPPGPPAAHFVLWLFVCTQFSVPWHVRTVVYEESQQYSI